MGRADHTRSGAEPAADDVARAGREGQPSRYRWTILSVGFAAQMAVGALIAAPAALAPTLAQAYGLSLGEMGVTLGSVQGGAVLSLLAWGSLADRFGERAVITTGLTGAGCAVAAAAATSAGGTLTVLLAIAGLLSASTVAASGRAVMGWFAPHEHGMALGIRQTAAMVGAALAAAVLPAVAAAAGLAASFAALAGFMACAAAAAAVWLREPPTVVSASAPVGPSPLRSKGIWRLAVGSAFLGLSQAAMLGFVVLFLHLQRRFSAGAAAAVLAAMTIGGALLRIALGYWSDRLPDRLALLRQATLALAATLCLTTMAMTAPVVIVVILLVAAGALATGWNGLAYAGVAQLAGRDRSGLALGLQQTLLQGVSAATPVVFALMISATSWRLAFALLVPTTVLAWLCFGDTADEPSLATV